MIINRQNMLALTQGFRTIFNGAFGAQEVPVYYPRVAMEVPSTTREEVYRWLGQLPRFREWIGDRVINNLSTAGFSIVNKDFEMTVGVGRNEIEDDQYGVYGPMIAEMGAAARVHPDELLWALFAQGFAAVCYDGQYFFDTDHPVLDANGVAQSVSNSQGGGGTPWFLLDTTRTVKPMIIQRRKPYSFVAKDNPTDDNVFDRKEFVYGTDARLNVGFGLWQLAYGSKQTLDATNYAAARAAMMGMKGDRGRPLGLRPTLLVVPPSLEKNALEVIKADRNAAGAANIWQGTAEVLNVPYL